MMSMSSAVPGRRALRGVLVLVLVVGSLVCAAGSAFSQAIDIPAILDPDLKAPPTAITLQYGHQFKADVENNGTEMARDNVFFSVAQRVKAGEKTSIFFLGSYTYHGYDFSGGSNTRGAALRTGPQNFYQWDGVHRGVIGSLVGYDVTDKVRLIGGGVIRSWGEGGASFGDTLSGGLILGASYQPREELSVGLIIGAFSALEDGVGLLPVPTLKWQFAEDWRWTVGMVSVFDPGVGTELAWQISDDVSIGTGLAFQSRRFRLRDRNRAGNKPSRPNRDDDGGVGQETEVPIFAMVRWRPTPRSSVDLLGGVAVAGNVRVEDKDGGRIADDSYDAAPFVGLRGQFFF